EDLIPTWEVICHLLDQLERVSPEFKESIEHTIATSSSHSLSADTVEQQCEAGPSRSRFSEDVQYHSLWVEMKRLMTRLLEDKVKLNNLRLKIQEIHLVRRIVMESVGECMDNFSRSASLEQATSPCLEEIEQSLNGIMSVEEKFEGLLVELVHYKIHLETNAMSSPTFDTRLGS
ncbi:hypothetical protein QAD02_009005, partial [Eretmocerus hayati]